MSQIIPVVYGICFVLLLVQAIRLMGRGFSATSSRKDRASTRSVTVHPELLDQEGNLLEDELLTVRFTGDNEPPAAASPDEQPDDSPPLAPR
ncbi:DUF2973 domain-containing protein [Candidatus Synechococcus spongiarum]|uniref:Diguanylate cyclase/phosphodiesterase (GGDEF & EAL domains) with PAS/PAC sensor(S) n=1 Tax=Candidatus Synechococcus spongiarum TaxID=431041 RepID=A0A165AFQ5_9SYNE|nr:DUF2973 domain-containing protein [Candidatus Synechococcus spongiarum]SAY38842.1 diguanylate cyclase/phosphodiesterase (GGDEF & EAL domains) with PAS/PAC sensor(s) [Candidatus Synechococcus spongiarum]